MRCEGSPSAPAPNLPAQLVVEGRKVSERANNWGITRLSYAVEAAFALSCPPEGTREGGTANSTRGSERDDKFISTNITITAHFSPSLRASLTSNSFYHYEIRQMISPSFPPTAFSRLLFRIITGRGERGGLFSVLLARMPTPKGKAESVNYVTPDSASSSLRDMKT